MQVMLNLKAILDEAGGTFEDVVKTTILLDSMDDFAAVNKLYGARPAKPTCIVATAEPCMRHVCGNLPRP